MRANSSLSGLVVVVLAVVGCSPADPPVVLAPPEPTTPEPVLAPTQVTVDELLREAQPVRIGQSQIPIDDIPELSESSSPFQVSNELAANTLSPRVHRLVFQCTDDVSFAVRSAGGRLEVYPPGHSHGYIVLTQQPSDSGLYYTASGAELRMNDDLATLQVGRDRHVDCVSNPAASVWEDPLRGGTPSR
jgi:hypothetical protein